MFVTMKKHLFVMLALFALLAAPMAIVAQDDAEDMADGMGADVECPAPENLPETVTIGAIFGLSGPISIYGGPQSNSVTLAVEEINASEYLGEGVTLEVLFEDSEGAAEGAINAMTKLVESDGVVAVLGPTLSTEAFAADPIAQENGVPVMGVSNTASGITDMGDFVFRNSLPESSVIPGTIAQATELLGLEAVGVLYGDDDDFTLSGYDVFVEALEANDVAILGEETFARGDTDFNAQLTNLLADDPDALVVSSLAAEAGVIISQARQQGFDGPIIGGNGLNSPAIIEQAGEAAEGVIVGAAWNVNATDDLSAAFIVSYEEANGSLPDQFSAQAYTGAWLMGTAIRCADSADPADIRDVLASIEDFNSPLGLFSFDEDRNPVHDPVLQIIEDGAFVVFTGDDM
jgi:branched-chain amino acid transport system substrate-binding protein